MSNAERIGVYGGTFDPIHNTHLEIARVARRHANLDRVLFIVAARPPHKRHDVFAEAEDRLALVEAALAGEPGMEASRIEMDRRGLSFTVDTLREIHRRIPGADLYLILGYDSLVELPGWYEPEAILQQARLLAVPRPGVLPAVPPMLDGHFEQLRFEENNLSSTEIRQRIAAGDDISALVPGAAARLIHEKGLYREHP